MALPPGYELHAGPPSVPEYRRLRAASGLTPVSQAQAEKAIPGTWAFRHVRFHTAAISSRGTDHTSGHHDAAGEAVAMGRIVGDGGWYFVVADMATMPDHQRRGLGRVILTALLDEVRASAEPGAFVTLTADPPGRRLYESLGFEDVRIAEETGMRLWLRD
ncbi:GNAT family N-acetyltransferase [Brevibacterium yomogidense]|uniref:GNAT family N-acetyltransferase n=1 Tax=Brevibacterium yomogidense TaxID=946573 RepID=UPI0018DF651F|nr:GNAT family N-acetyltransferase [Brevibacterium yomogidense]